MSSPALNMLWRAVQKPVVVASPPPAGEPAAPVVVPGSFRKAKWSSAGTHTLTMPAMEAGDVIVAGGYLYGNNPVVNPAISDAVHGAYDAALGTALNIDAAVSGTPSSYTTLNAFTKRVPANVAAGTVLTITGGQYATVIMALIRGVDATTMLDGAVGSFVGNGTVGAPPTIDMPVTTYSHDLQIAFFSWYQSAQVQVLDANYPMVGDGYNDGDNNTNQMVMVSRTVTATGNYDPRLSPPSGQSTFYAGIGFNFKGKSA